MTAMVTLQFLNLHGHAVVAARHPDDRSSDNDFAMFRFLLR
jgi:hypothetical protein